MFDEIKREDEEDDYDEEIKQEDEEDADVDEFGRCMREEDKRKQKGLLATYKFRVCDNLLNIGPIADFAVGESFDGASASLAVLPIPLLSWPAFDHQSTPQEHESKRSVEIVTCSGVGRNGSLCVLQVAILHLVWRDALLTDLPFSMVSDPS